jgi:hypothetical protein
VYLRHTKAGAAIAYGLRIEATLAFDGAVELLVRNAVFDAGGPDKAGDALSVGCGREEGS